MNKVPKKEKKQQKKDVKEDSPEKQIKEIDKKIEQKLEEFQKLRGCKCVPFLGFNIVPEVIDATYEELEKNYKDCNGKLDIIIDSGGGDINSAYNLSMLFRTYGNKKLTFFVPRWAKSAATLLVCSGDEIIMTPIAELGPVDPQITQINPFEKRMEKFSPLAIESTLDLIRKEYREGSEKLANSLMERLQFPLTLGTFSKSIEIAEQYLTKLLETRMFSSIDKKPEAKKVANILTKGYADHGFCINLDEVKNIGLNVSELKGKELEIVWEMYRLFHKRRKIKTKMREEEITDLMKELPPELLDILEKTPSTMSDNLKKEMSDILNDKNRMEKI